MGAPERREGRFLYEVALPIAGFDNYDMAQLFQPVSYSILDAIGQQAVKGRVERQHQGRIHGVEVVKRKHGWILFGHEKSAREDAALVLLGLSSETVAGLLGLIAFSRVA